MTTNASEPRPNDEVLADVCARLRLDPHLDISTLDVDVDDGEVLLSGTVDDYPAKRRAENIAGAVPGVDRVRNNLRLRKSAGVMPDVRKGTTRVAR
jgi:osmotically-inducible protein OsmY